jgi:2-aminoadipate transaminase
MSLAPLRFSQKSLRTPESPISYFMEQAIENPTLISLAAGLVDSSSLPATPVSEAVQRLLRDPQIAKIALQYGTTQGYTPLREKVLHHVTKLDGITPKDIQTKVSDVVITTGSQQLLYMLGELLFDPGDIVITEAPSYFVFHSVLAGNGVRIFSVPLDDDGMQIDKLGSLLADLEYRGELNRVKLIYSVNYFQNPTGLTLSETRRKQLVEVVQQYRDRQRILVLEDAAYRELRYEGDEIRTIKSFDTTNEFVIYAGTFSKPCSPGLKTGYALMPSDLIEPIIRLKGNHDFGSSNFSQHILNNLMETSAYHRHVEYLRTVYRPKRDAMLNALADNFAGLPGVHWTHPRGGMFVWFSLPESLSTSANTPFFRAAIKEGVLYIPGEYGYVAENITVAKCHARLSFGETTIDQIQEGIRRLRRATETTLQGTVPNTKEIAKESDSSVVCITPA